MPNAPSDITELLRCWADGDAAALDRLVPLLYGHLHDLAHHRSAPSSPRGR